MAQSIPLNSWFEIDSTRQQLMIRFFDELNIFMSARHGYKRNKCRPSFNKVDAACPKFILTLGFNIDYSVRISTIIFREKRRGHCTALMNFIDNKSIEYKIPYIEIVSVESEAMNNFVKKNGFIRYDAYYSMLEQKMIQSVNWYRKTTFAISCDGDDNDNNCSLQT